MLPVSGEQRIKDVAMAAHFGYGAAAGALLAAPNARIGMGRGLAGGIAVWGLSYLGWIPAAGVLRPAHQHPVRRTLLMIAAHAAWGAATALTSRELDESRMSVLGKGPLADSY